MSARPNDDPVRPFVFDPEVIEVGAGTTIRWINRSQTFHTVTFSPSTGERVADGTFEESMFEIGDRIQRTMPATGSFRFFCQPHAEFMIGAVTVFDPPVRTGRRVAGVLLVAFSIGVASVAAVGRRRA